VDLQPVRGYATVLFSWQLVKLSYMNMPAAAAACTVSCRTLCLLPAANFSVEAALVNQTLYRFEFSVPSVFRTGPRPSAIRWHERDVYWLNPKRQPAYCEWGWQDW
jgi:hypothetical protein